MIKAMKMEHKLAQSAEEFWQLPEKQDYNDDLWGHYMSLIYFVDYWDYKNCHGYHEPLPSRHSLGCIGQLLPSLAYINPHKTKELSFYLHLIVKNLQNDNLTDSYHQFDSRGVLLVHQGLAAAFYHMVSGRRLHDEDFHRKAAEIYQEIISNKASMQKTCGIQTLSGQFHPLVNLMGLMVLHLHDRFFSTTYSQIGKELLNLIARHLTDKESGMFHDSYHTGALGFKGEILAPTEAWSDCNAKASTNGYTISYMHYFAPKQAEKAWDSYKAAYRPYLLSLDASALCRQTGASYFTALNEEAESYYGAMMAAREMDDKEFFEALLTHLNQIAAPRLAEGKIWFDALGSCQDLHAFYILLAKSHIPWKLLLNHDWEHYYAYDFNEVR